MSSQDAPKPVMTRARLVIAVVLAAALVGALLWLLHPRKAADELVLYGNVDLRQVELAFNGSERVVQVLAAEGDRVSRGQVLARLDTGRLGPQAAQAAAQVAAQQQAVDRLRAGSRPEEIDQAKANLAAAQAEATDAAAKAARGETLFKASGGKALSRQELDDAKAASAAAAARVAASQQSLRLAQIGPRKEDIAQAQAQLQGARAQLALMQKDLADAVLTAPSDATVRPSVSSSASRKKITQPRAETSPTLSTEVSQAFTSMGHQWSGLIPSRRSTW